MEKGIEEQVECVTILTEDLARITTDLQACCIALGVDEDDCQ